jgi:hypothetical protein
MNAVPFVQFHPAHRLEYWDQERNSQFLKAFHVDQLMMPPLFPLFRANDMFLE